MNEKSHPLVKEHIFDSFEVYKATLQENQDIYFGFYFGI